LGTLAGEEEDDAGGGGGMGRVGKMGRRLLEGGD
jgi:hypothetical protein